MRTDELKEAADRIRKVPTCDSVESLHELYGNHPHRFESNALTSAMIDADRRMLADAYLASVAADEQQAERIATLERERDEANERRSETVAMCEQLRAERDEARAAYCKLREMYIGPFREGQANDLLCGRGLLDKPEWRKGDA